MSPRPRLLLITPDFPPAKGGIQTLSHRIACSMRTFDPVVVTLDHSDAPGFDAEQSFPIVRAPVRGARPATILALNATATALALRRRPDVVLSSHIVVAPSAALTRCLRGVPFVQYVHAKELGAKPGLARFALARADLVVAVSRYTRDLAVQAGASPSGIVLIHPGVDVPARTDTGQERNGRPTLLTIARLEDRYKGHDVLLRALPLIRSEVPGVRWQVVGDGPLRPALEDRAHALGLDGVVEFLGSLSDEARDRKLSDADVFCMVSRLPAGGFAGEGFGIVYLEANAHGLPVVAGNVGGATDAVVQGETGILVDPDDHLAVADAIVTLLRDPAGSRAMGRQGRVRAAKLSWDEASHRLERRLEELLQK